MAELGGAKINSKKNCNSLPNWLKLIKFGGIVQQHELQKIFDYFLRVIIPLKTIPSSTEL